LKTRRIRWHHNCGCDCTFCTECDHGKNPDQGECHYGSCKRCEHSECPIEYNEDEQGKNKKKKRNIPPILLLLLLLDIDFSSFQIESWLDRAYVHKDGKFQKEDESMDDTRMLLMGRITFELKLFNEHNDHVEWWKKVWTEMKEKLLSDHIIIRWDFIGKRNNYYISLNHTLFFKKQKTMSMKIPMPCHPVTLERNKQLSWLQWSFTRKQQS
jgi:hypothetical protein